MSCSLDVYFNQYVNLCVRVGALSQTGQVALVQGDTGPKLNFTLKNCDGDILVSGVSGALFHLRPYCGPKSNCGHEDMASGVSLGPGVWQYCLEPGDVSIVGSYFGDVEIFYFDGTFETGFEPVRIFVRESNRPCP